MEQPFRPSLLKVGRAGLWCLCLALGVMNVTACNRVDVPPDDTGDGGDPFNKPKDLHFDNDAFWAQDPPPAMCSLDGGMFPQPPAPGGTPECPDDKNREGCPCPKAGMTAPCWPGLRANRNLGICKDGVTTCIQSQELAASWGPCEGYQLPLGGTGKDGCTCFSAGRWAIQNLVPCFADFGGGGGIGSAGAVSSVLVNGKPTCTVQNPLQVPAQPWSTDTVQVDCSGRFKLCYTLKAGKGSAPTPQDCTLVQVCTQGDYTKVNEMQVFPPLPAWKADSAAAKACALKFVKDGGYGEMSVDGQTVACDQIQKVFNRISYCPLSCNDTPNDPMCINCRSDGSGGF